MEDEPEVGHLGDRLLEGGEGVHHLEGHLVRGELDEDLPFYEVRSPPARLVGVVEPPDAAEDLGEGAVQVEVKVEGLREPVIDSAHQVGMGTAEGKKGWVSSLDEDSVRPRLRRGRRVLIR